MIEFQAFSDSIGTKLPNVPTLKPGSLTAGQTETSKVLWSSPGDQFQVGIWECSVGKFPSTRPDMSEVCHVLTGRVEIEDEDGEKRLLKAGDTFVLARGWQGHWNVLEPLRKLYIFNREA
ncbi:cupin domain-containing protein [Ochrobactrum sp. WV_118_8]|uniref:cupin domain-containing protein n=1 Tax=Brucella anthropi TaxID=529 RepID=UPI00188CFA5F|nr:cupin domain-containing protein [Brucella anthropi]QPA29856.1 DUF861 domain-containing protein [Brucella anthropi]